MKQYLLADRGKKYKELPWTHTFSTREFNWGRTYLFANEEELAVVPVVLNGSYNFGWNEVRSLFLANPPRHFAHPWLLVRWGRDGTYALQIMLRLSRVDDVNARGLWKMAERKAPDDGVNGWSGSIEFDRL